MSMWAGVCTLVSESSSKDEYGVQQTVESARAVPCNVFRMGDAAYYAAAAAGIHPEAVLQVRRCAYCGERLVELEGHRLRIERVDRSAPTSCA